MLCLNLFVHAYEFPIIASLLLVLFLCVHSFLHYLPWTTSSLKGCNSSTSQKILKHLLPVPTSLRLPPSLEKGSVNFILRDK